MKFFASIFLAIMPFCAAAVTADYNVIPLPNTINLTAEAPFMLGGDVTIAADEANVHNADMLAGYVKESAGIVIGKQGAGKVIKLKSSLQDANEEAYTITVCCDSVVINGASPAGTFHGIQTLRKSLPIGQFESIELPAGNIYDFPRFEYRGAHLDVCRHFFDVDEVKTFIDMLALHNLNTFHWHLSDDQGWRIEIKSYPLLTELSSVRKETVIGRLPGKWDGIPHGGFYTQEEAREIVAYAAERYINVIPEIDMPGHMQAALHAYPELGCTGGPYEVWTEWGVTPEVLCAGNDTTLVFIKKVLDEIMDIFPSKYINIGGDECPKDHWKECPKCQARIKAEGITAKGKFSAEDRLQGFITRYAYGVVSERGRIMVGWDEILESDIPSDAIVMSWRGSAGAVEGAQRGNRVIQTPNTHMYFDFYQSKDVQFEPFAIGGYIPVEKVYNFEPVPAELTAEQKKLVIGCQSNLWTEYILDFPQVQYMELPRLAALCEVQWTAPEKKNYEFFKDRIPAMFSIYENLGYNYAKHLGDITAVYTPVPKKKALKVEFSTLKGNDIYYTLDGTEPTENSIRYGNEFYVKENVIIKAAAFRKGGKSRTLCDTITTNAASFTKITLKNAPAENYTFAGAPTLVDGICGNGNYRTGRWLGFINTDCDATIDLGKKQTVNELSFNVCIFQCDGVVDASAVTVKGSVNGNDYVTIATQDFGEIDRSKEFGTVTHTIALDGNKYRYINVAVSPTKNLPAWHGFAGSPAFLFVDEISVK